VGEKTVSYVRKEFRATAESRQRPPLLAEAMVDADIAIPGVVDKGKLLTLTTEEALQQKLVATRADTLEEVLQKSGLAGAEVRRLAPNWAENLVRWLTHPVVSSLLVTMAMVGILVELRTPGFGFPGAIGAGSLGLFLWGHWLAQLAGWEELLLVIGGVLLLALELLVIPGFGIAGVLGLLALLGGLVLAMVGPGDTAQFVLEASTRVVFSLIFAIVLGLALLRLLGRSSAGRRLVLETALTTARGYASAPDEDNRWLGRVGVAATPLHPAGIVAIEGHRVDVVSDGNLIDAGETVKVIRVDGNRIVVSRSGNQPTQEEGA
jgi:membrane-bound serine protease (ClpP class)